MSVTLQDIKSFYIYCFTFIDDYTFVLAPVHVLDTAFGPASQDWPVFEAELEARWREAGWEGDGRIGAIWLPPFVSDDFDRAGGGIVWHVKQANNGVSFLASPFPLPFELLINEST